MPICSLRLQPRSSQSGDVGESFFKDEHASKNTAKLFETFSDVE
jgi:hypothetical protein